MAQLQIGDKIAVSGNYGTQAIKKIDRVTDTLAFIGDVKLKREYGPESFNIKEVGAQKWSSTCYRIATEAHEKELRIKIARHTVERAEWGKLSDEKIFEILKIIKS